MCSTHQRVLALTIAAAALAFAAPAYATYPGRNGTIAFSGGDPNGAAQIWTVDPHGQDLRQLTRLNGDAVNQDWSPDGRSMIFALDAPDGVSVEPMRADGTHSRRGIATQPCPQRPSEPPPRMNHCPIGA